MHMSSKSYIPYFTPQSMEKKAKNTVKHRPQGSQLSLDRAPLKEEVNIDVYMASCFGCLKAVWLGLL